MDDAGHVVRAFSHRTFLDGLAPSPLGPWFKEVLRLNRDPAFLYAHKTVYQDLA
ncbi:hypothetical protein BM1_08328 [Bipolaris maydis]|nr:hypothetical protein BM1_08328 [Bipolaris maydis]